MRLREVQKIIDENIQSLQLNFHQQMIAREQYFRASGKNRFNSSVSELAKVPGLIEVIKPILNSPALSLPGDEFSITNSDYQVFSTNLEFAKSVLSALSRVLKGALPIQSPNSISFKLPDRYDFGDVSGSIDELRDAIDPLVLEPGIEGKFSVQNFDSGTLWIEVVVGSLKATVLFQSVIWGAMEVAKKYLEYETSNQMLRSIQMQVEIQEKIKTLIDAKIDEIAREQAKKISDQAFEGIPDDNEREMKIVRSLKILTDLLLKGAEFHPALTAKEEVKKNFPKFDEMERLLSSVTKLLEKKQKDTD